MSPAVVLNQETINNAIIENQEAEDGSFTSSHSSDFVSDSNDGPAEEGDLKNVKKKQGRKGSNACSKFSLVNHKAYLVFQLGLQCCFMVVVLLSLLYNNKNLVEIIKINETAQANNDISAMVVATPEGAKSGESFAERASTISQLAKIERVLVLVMLLESLLKVVNQYCITYKPTVKKGSSDSKKKDSADLIFDSGFIYVKGEPLISSSIIVLDLFVVLAILVLNFIEQSMTSNVTINYLQIGALLVARLCLRVPYTVQLASHHYKLRLCRLQQQLIFPNRDKKEFATYKEKVLYILEQIRAQFGKVIYMSHPNNDLGWCQFVIENDYLQISNSISTGTS